MVSMTALRPDGQLAVVPPADYIRAALAGLSRSDGIGPDAAAFCCKTREMISPERLLPDGPTGEGGWRKKN